jgi:hypothetical protein
MLTRADEAKVQDLISDSIKKCPVGSEIRAEIGHCKQELTDVKTGHEALTLKVDNLGNRIFDRIEDAEKTNSGRWMSFFLLLIGQLIVFGTGLLYIILRKG